MDSKYKVPCGKTTGHGMSCCDGMLCSGCAEVSKLRGAQGKLVAALKGARELLANTEGLSKNNIDNLAGEQVLAIDAALAAAGAA